MINGIYFIILFTYTLWVIGISNRNEIISLLSAFCLFGLSVYMFINGIDIFVNDNLLVQMFSAVTFAIAVYTSYQASYSLYQDL